MFTVFVSQLKDALEKPLPGKKAHNLLKPYLKINRYITAPQLLKPKIAAVLAIIYPIDNKPHLLFIERPIYDGAHSGQIAFPGGKIEATDKSYLDTALRETYEEIGITIEEHLVLAPLTEVFVLASNFMVYPFVGYLNEKPILTLDKIEVATTFEVPLDFFLTPNIIQEKPMKSAMGFTLMAPYYDLNGKILWGATAMMVSELIAVIKRENIL